VPHEDLYEQGFWPSLFAPGHNATFCIGKMDTWSPASYDILNLVQELPCAEVVSTAVQDEHYNYSLQVGRFRGYRRLLYRLMGKILAIMCKMRLQDSFLWYWVERGFILFGIPIDQTAGDALAQIEVIVQKDGLELRREADNKYSVFGAIG
jgi:hypothetical protein